MTNMKIGSFTGSFTIKNSENNNYDFRVITFNLLSSFCASKEYFPFVKAHFLDFASRSTRVKKLIESWTKVNFIICLQEVDELWFKVLEPVFIDKKYGIHTARYTDGTMGQLIAYPEKHFDRIFVDQFIPGSFIKEMYEKISENKEVNVDDNKTIMDQLSEGSKSPNIMISVGLSAKYYGKTVDKYIIVSTYHMPCKFKDPFLMISHIHALKSRLEQIINVRPGFSSIVLTGDFNMLDTSDEYMYMTDSSADNIIVDLMNSLYKSTNVDLKQTIQFKSAHTVCHSKEPEYTNCSVKKNKNFVGTLDYIFISQNIGVRSCTVGLIAPPLSDNTENTTNYLYYNKTKLPLYPNAVCPSDHLALSSSLFIESK